MTDGRPLVIGAGPAGSACAIHLATAGAAPLVIERRRQPDDALCGGFLSWRTLDRLAALGIPHRALGGHDVTHMRIFHGRTSRAIALPRAGMGLSRRRLDQLLRARAWGVGAELAHGSASFDRGRIRLDDGRTLDRASIFVATGKRDLRGLPRPRDAAGADPMIGLRWRMAAHCELQDLLQRHIEVHLFDRGYFGLVLHEDGTANLCMAVRKSRLADAGGRPGDLIAQLAGANAEAAARLRFLQEPECYDAIGHIPYHWRAAAGPANVFRLGDQAAVIASLAGEGIGIALASAAEAVRCWRSCGAGASRAFQARFAARLRRPLAAARIVAELAQSDAGARTIAGLSALPGAMALVAKLTRV